VSGYGTSTVRRLVGRLAAELDEWLFEIAEREQPTSVRGMYYSALGYGLVDKD
jgi:phage portal protein BeeE